MMVPILEAVQTLNSYGMEVVSGIILGLDTDTPDSGKRLLDFIEQSQIPMLTINLLQALPRTPLWDRLKRESRLIEDDDGRESNVAFRLPYEQVLAMWRDCMRVAYRAGQAFWRATSTRSEPPIPTGSSRRTASQRAPTWAQHPARTDHAGADSLARRRARRLPARVLAIRLDADQAAARSTISSWWSSSRTT